MLEASARFCVSFLKKGYNQGGEMLSRYVFVMWWDKIVELNLQ